MQAKLTVNGEDFSVWMMRGGLRYYDIARQGRSIVGLDGVEHRSEIIKRGISVSLVELRDSTWDRLRDALTSPCVVRYTEASGQEVEKLFYASALEATAKTVRGGNTYYSGAKFTLEEK